ncbi:hypothetical protein ABPG72_012147 [Tetrahymena utriculariae]
MKTSDFIRGMVVAYMDVRKSSRQTAASISEIITKHQKPNQMIDESIYSEFSISHTECQTIYKQFTSTLSYADQRINNGRQNKQTYSLLQKIYSLTQILQHKLHKIPI